MGAMVVGTRALRMAARLWWAPVVAVGAVVDRGSRTRWLLTPGIVMLAAFASTFGKLVVRRPRPGTSVRVAPVGRLGAAGFPSTHATCAFAIAGWQRRSRQRRWLHLVATAISYSRVRSGAHHYIDVFAGAALGYGISLQVDAIWSGSLAPRPAGSLEAPKSRFRGSIAAHRRPHSHGANPRSEVRSGGGLAACEPRGRRSVVEAPGIEAARLGGGVDMGLTLGPQLWVDRRGGDHALGGGWLADMNQP